MRKLLAIVLVILILAIISLSIFTVVDARQEIYHENAEVVSKKIKIDSNGKREYCVQFYYEYGNIEATIWLCKRYSFQVGYNDLEIGQKFIYAEKRWLWWWE